MVPHTVEGEVGLPDIERYRLITDDVEVKVHPFGGGFRDEQEAFEGEGDMRGFRHAVKVSGCSRSLRPRP